MTHIVDLLLALPPLLVLLAALVLPALEASALIGLIVPGETAVFVAGVTAHAGHLPLWAVISAAAVGAVVGDQIGFRVGRRLGPRLLARLPRRVRDRGHVERAVALVSRRGGWAVLIGRWTALLRALVPGLAGASGMAGRTFSLFNVIGGLIWAGVVSMVGYLAGAAYTQVLARMNTAGQIGLGAVVLVVVIVWIVLRIRRRRAARFIARSRPEATPDARSELLPRS